MLRRHNHIGHAEQCITTGRINPQLIFFSFNGKVHFRTGRLADPILLRDLDPLHVVHGIQPLNQLIRIFRDLQHPLALHLAHHFCTAPLTDAVHHFLIGKPDFTGSTPVNRHLGFIGKSRLKQLQEDPLRPFIIRRIRRIDLSVPVKRISQRMELAFETGDIILCHDLRMNMVLNRIILRRQAESVPAHRIKDIISLHPSLSGYNVKRRIRSRMSHMKSLSRRIREFYQRIIFRSGIIVRSLKRLLVIPHLLPFCFHLSMVIYLCHSASILIGS